MPFLYAYSLGGHINWIGRESRMKKPLRRAAMLLGLLVAAVYMLASGYLWLNENAMVFVGADLDADERLIVSGQASIPWERSR